VVGVAMRDWDAFNKGIVEDFREHGGKVSGNFANSPLLLLTTTGAKSGRQFTIPLVYTRDGDRLVVIASKGGSPTHPDWYHNLVKHPEVVIEIGTDRYPARAIVTEGDERQRLFDAQVKEMPFFAEYQRKVERQIPVVAFERIAS